MGYGDDRLLDAEPHDSAMLRVLAHVGQPAPVDPPPDLVTRSLRRLPAAPPASASRAALLQRWLRLAVGGALAGALALLTLLSCASLLGSPAPAMLFGDGSGGLSRLLLWLSLSAKPLLHTIQAVGPWAPLSAALVAVGGGWLWWRLIHSVPMRLAGEVTQ